MGRSSFRFLHRARRCRGFTVYGDAGPGAIGRGRAADAKLSGAAVQSCTPSRLLIWRTCRSEEHTSELQSLMRISYAVFCLKKKNTFCLPWAGASFHNPSSDTLALMKLLHNAATAQ